MKAAILFWMAKPVADLLLTVLVLVGLGLAMLSFWVFRAVCERMDAWIYKKRRSN